MSRIEFSNDDFDPAYLRHDDEDYLEDLYLRPPLSQLSPPDYCSGDAQPTEIPEYSCGLLPDEVFLDGTPQSYSRRQVTPAVLDRRPQRATFVYRSRTSELQLKSSSRQTQTPAYGRGEKIEGFVRLHAGLKHVERVDLIIEGIVTTTTIDRGNPISSSQRTVLRHTEMLLDNSHCESQSSTQSDPQQYPISYQLPLTMEGSNSRLPPSFFKLYSTIEGIVRYTLRVDVVKRGVLRRNEKLETIFLYLPKTAPPSLLPPSWYHYTSGAGSSSAGPSRDYKPPVEPAQDRSAKEWKSFPLDCGPAHPDLDIQLSLMKPLTYQAQTEIPFSLTASYRNAVLPDLILASSQVALLKRTTISSSGSSYTNDEVIGSAAFGKAESPADGAGGSTVIRVANGCIYGGRKEGETSWEVSDLVKVSYAIRLDVVPSTALQGAIPILHHLEPIELTTHSADDAEDDDALSGPALGIVGRL